MLFIGSGVLGLFYISSLSTFEEQNRLSHEQLLVSARVVEIIMAENLVNKVPSGAMTDTPKEYSDIIHKPYSMI